MDSVTFYDAEFLTAPGAPQRFWCGPEDPDPLTIKIGAVRLGLTPPFDLSETASWFVTPVGRDGQVVSVAPLVTQLTGIDDALLAREGMTLGVALTALADFAQGDVLFAWGKDELLTIAASLFVTGQTSPIPATRFRNAVPLLVAAGVPAESVVGLRSHTLCAHFGLEDPGTAHDAAGDCLSVATVFQHLLREGRLMETDFTS